MNYIISIKTAIFVFPIIAFLFTIPFILHQYHKYGSINKLRVLIIYSFILYLITVYFLVILPLPSIEDVIKLKTPKYNIMPFSFVKDIIENSPFIINDISTYLKTFNTPSFYIALFNIFMTIPYGIYLRYYFKCNLKQTILLSFLLSLFFEVTQLTGLYFIYPRPYRLFDVDDLILNTTGGLIGYLLARIILKFLPTRDEIDKKSILLGMNVSGLRRITLFSLDLFLYFGTILSLNTLIKLKYLKYIIFIIYFVLIPYIWNNQTIGSRFLKIRFNYSKYTLINSIIRAIFYYIYYIELPYTFIYIKPSILGLLLLNVSYFINFIIILKNRTIYYDKIFRITYQSTINNNKDNML